MKWFISHRSAIKSYGVIVSIAMLFSTVQAESISDTSNTRSLQHLRKLNLKQTHEQRKQGMTKTDHTLQLHDRSLFIDHTGRFRLDLEQGGSGGSDKGGFGIACGSESGLNLDVTDHVQHTIDGEPGYYIFDMPIHVRIEGYDGGNGNRHRNRHGRGHYDHGNGHGYGHDHGDEIGCWRLSCQLNDSLRSNIHAIMRQNTFLRVEPEGEFHPLDQSILLLEEEGGGEFEFDITLRVLTSWQDPAGSYNGLLQFEIEEEECDNDCDHDGNGNNGNGHGDDDDDDDDDHGHNDDDDCDGGNGKGRGKTKG
ncbi:hypothetical protein K8I28_10650 [bacterium]|nr:hypothetical protein [bacterium]